MHHWHFGLIMLAILNYYSSIKLWIFWLIIVNYNVVISRNGDPSSHLYGTILGIQQHQILSRDTVRQIILPNDTVLVCGLGFNLANVLDKVAFPLKLCFILSNNYTCMLTLMPPGGNSYPETTQVPFFTTQYSLGVM